MSQPQPRGPAAFLFAVFLAAVLVGIGWRASGSGSDNGAGASRPEVRRSASAGVDRVRHIEIPAGWRAEQIAQALDRSSIADGARFLAIVRRRSLEGRLYPGLYSVGPEFSIEKLVAEMTSRFDDAFSPAMRRRATALGFSTDEVLSLASIVQREMVYASEAPVIASVYQNRLHAGMALKADPTVIYALDSVAPGRAYWDRRLSFSDLRVDSPFNTYRRRGLPPRPIASPSREAIAAVLYPADVPYRFFVARGDGTHVFARTGREHLELVRGIRERRGSPRPQSPLQPIVERLMSVVPAHVGVVVRNLRTGESAAVNGDEFFTTASLYKLAVMLTGFELRERGRLSFDQRVEISPRAAAEDSSAILARLGRRPTIRNVIEQMIVVSSNAAGVTLLHEFGRRRVDRVLRRYGLRDTSLTSLRIVTTPNDMARLLELLARHRAVSPQASAEMVRVMLRQEIGDRLPKYLPAGVRLAHKTGTLDFPSHDAGILYTRAGPIVIVAMTEDATRRGTATEAVARLGRVVYDYFESYEPAARRLAARGNAACPGSPFRSRVRGVLTGKRIVLDPGHGGRSVGARVTLPDGRQAMEKEITLDVALRLKRMLTARGATVYMTRCRDAFRSLAARAAIANAAGPHAFVSLHLGGSGDRQRNGTQVAYLLPDGRRLANYLLGRFSRPALWEALSKTRPLPNDGVQRHRLVELTDTLAPAAQTESVFLTNPAEARALVQDDRRREAIARGHLLGLLNYFGVDQPRARPARPRTVPPDRARTGVVRIAAAGDIALGTTPLLPSDGGRSLFDAIRPHLVGDVVVGNLETALAATGKSKCEGSRRTCYAFRSPPWYAPSLRHAGFNVLNLANNHARDFGVEGFAQTLEALDTAGIAHTGRVGQIARLQTGSLRVAVIGFAPYAGVQNLLDLRAARALVERADAWADVVIVTMHAGAEGAGAAHVHEGPEVYLGERRGDPVRFAHAVVEAGADLVVGHGPHVLRGAEWYRGRLIAYSLGNLAGVGNFALEGPLGRSAILQATLAADGSWRGGRLVGLRLIGAGTPTPDPAAAESVERLSREDFGMSGVHLSAGGRILAPQQPVGPVRITRGRSRRIQAQRAALDEFLQLGAPVYCGGGRGRYVALTFDDGPSPHTARLLRVLRRAGARATFFPVVDRTSARPALVRQEAALGAVGDHTLTHPDLRSLDPVSLTTEIAWAQRFVTAFAGGPVMLFRPPFGARDPRVDSVVRSNAMAEILWDVDGLDWADGATAAGVLWNVLGRLRPGSIVLLHDTYARTVDAVQMLLPLLRRSGYRLVTVPELLALDPPSLAQGRSQRGRRCLGEPTADPRAPALEPLPWHLPVK